MLSRVLSTAPLRSTVSWSTTCLPGLTSLKPFNQRTLKLYRLSRLHTSGFDDAGRSISAAYQSHKKFGFTIRENVKGIDKPNPIVVILGWNNSQHKYLAKYSEMFEKRGYDTLCSTANPFNTFFRSGSKVKEIAHRILDVLLEMNCSSRPVFLYAFSNGGGAVFFQLTEALSTPESKYFDKIKVAGSIFDSFPVVPEMKSVKIVQKTITGYIGNPIVRWLVWYGLGISIPLMILIDPNIKRYMHSITNSPINCDQLVLFSKTDPFAPSEDIEHFINERRKRGVHVVAKCWEKSHHVNHYREHPNEYTRIVYDFIDNCLKKM
ncbi:transmembrane protein 53-A-like [Actinia tenebrosa]|uniref:Transmembrane protein 53-A-like n=1 Tax=Actinia tenebrosa TaxID=6105 RepID=A0A6P8IAD5_ACTTE|nr:transmembrane protein 53-A-like [Actinia tenebrosa]